MLTGEEMADDINKAIANGGYVIVPEKTIEGSGRDAIYVYMTYNGQAGHQGWRISGGLNGGFFDTLGIISNVYPMHMKIRFFKLIQSSQYSLCVILNQVF